MEFHNMQISNYQYLTNVFQNLQKKLGTTENSSKFGIESMKTNILLWGLFMSSAMNYTENLEVHNTNFEEIKSLFGITQRLISEHSDEIFNVKSIESASPSWTRSTLSHDQVIRWTKAKVHVYSDSVLCVGKMYEHKEANRRW